MSSVNNSGLNPAVVAAGSWLDKAGESGKSVFFRGCWWRPKGS